MAARGKERENRTRDTAQRGFGVLEDALYVAVALALIGAGIILFGSVVYDFASRIPDEPISGLILDLLDGLLLVFIITELIHTVRVILNEKVLISEPFLVVGIVAAIRRLVIISAEAKDLLGKPSFTDALMEIGVLTVTVIALAGAIFMLRHTTHSEPRPDHEPG